MPAANAIGHADGVQVERAGIETTAAEHTRFFPAVPSCVFLHYKNSIGPFLNRGMRCNMPPHHPSTGDCDLFVQVQREFLALNEVVDAHPYRCNQVNWRTIREDQGQRAVDTWPVFINRPP